MAPTSTKTITTSPTPTVVLKASAVAEENKLTQRKASLTNGEVKPVQEVTEVPVMDKVVPVKIVWRNVYLFVYLHLAALYGAVLLLTGQVKWQTFALGTAYYFISGLGITAGCHRLWAHKSYKVKTPLKVLLAFFQTVAFQNSILEWSRDHRVHHKYSETNADPHNAKRGFFFAHMGWLLCRKHPAVKEYGKKIDMSDLERDPVVAFQAKHYLALVFVCCFIIPTLGPWYFWGESLKSAWFFCANFRYCVILHWTWLVNSAAHLYGNKPYDKNINPSENKTVAVLAMGEGWHNYHHTFPWDYKTAELGTYEYNITAAFIDFMAWIGQAYDLKTVPKQVVLQRVARTGDGTHSSQHHHHHEGAPWGWGDKDMSAEDAALTETIRRLEKEHHVPDSCVS